MDRTEKTADPLGEFEGYTIPHGEANTLSTKLSKYGYQPTVYFIYQPAEFARQTLEAMRPTYQLPSAEVVYAPDIEEGADIIGALIHTPTMRWWCGNTFGIEDTKKLGLKWSGPTTIQVAISILSALRYMIKHPKLGFITPEALPLTVLKDCINILGCVSRKL